MQSPTALVAGWNLTEPEIRGAGLVVVDSVLTKVSPFQVHFVVRHNLVRASGTDK
jgi:hypothetical protein